jgi:hypothetical protein
MQNILKAIIITELQMLPRPLPQGTEDNNGLLSRIEPETARLLSA